MVYFVQMTHGRGMMCCLFGEAGTRISPHQRIIIRGNINLHLHNEIFKDTFLLLFHIILMTILLFRQQMMRSKKESYTENSQQESAISLLRTPAHPSVQRAFLKTSVECRVVSKCSMNSLKCSMNKYIQISFFLFRHFT